MDLTPRQRLVAEALATDASAQFAPVQLKKLFFLIDETVADDLTGKLFRFVPYDYGPFDAAVYRELELLRDGALAQITDGSGPSRRYPPTPAGSESVAWCWLSNLRAFNSIYRPFSA